MAIFNSYVKLPEGSSNKKFDPVFVVYYRARIPELFAHLYPLLATSPAPGHTIMDQKPKFEFPKDPCMEYLHNPNVGKYSIHGSLGIVYTTIYEKCT